MVKKVRRLTRHPAVFLFILLTAMAGFTGISHAGAPAVGKTYDRTNYQEIEEHLASHMKTWLQQGKFGFTVSAEDFDFGGYDDTFRNLSRSNLGKYIFNEAGQMVDKSTGDYPEYVEGIPFLDVDQHLDSPYAGAMIMENMQCFREHELIYKSAARVDWVPASGGSERDLGTTGKYLYYWNRLDGPIPNPTQFRKQDITLILAPYDIRGIVVMGWQYIDEEKEDSSFQFLPMLRRVKRSSAASRSDPFMGSDGCVDDAAGWAGKNSSMTWKYLGKGDYVVPHAYNKKLIITQNPDKTFNKWFADIKMGYETPGWQYAGYFPSSAVPVAER